MIFREGEEIALGDLIELANWMRDSYISDWRDLFSNQVWMESVIIRVSSSSAFVGA